MQFTSAEYLLFFPVTVLLFYAIPFRFRWLLLLTTSAYFYSCAPTGCLPPIIVATLVTWYAARLIQKSLDNGERKVYLSVALFLLIGNLTFFKYGHILIRVFDFIASYLGLRYESLMSDYALPVGISFYTFLTVGYLIDIFRRDYTPEENLGVFSLYVLFFPKLLAGPIERGRNLLAQFRRERAFDPNWVKDGLKLIAWGLFKKLVIANRAAQVVDTVYASPSDHYGWIVVFTFYLYAFQIYCDFSGYTDIAIGSARIMGYDLLENFKRPYLATSIRAFWRRWHISLTSWLRDYLYVPLGGNRVTKWRWYVNIMVVFVLSGIWHGSGITFVAWGSLHGLYYIATVWVEQITAGPVISGYRRRFDRIANFLGVFITFHLVVFAWVFFRADSVAHAWQMICNAVHLDGTLQQALHEVGLWRGGLLLLGIGVVMGVEMVEETGAFQWLSSSWVRWLLYYLLSMSVLLLGVSGVGDEFIYGRF